MSRADNRAESGPQQLADPGEANDPGAAYAERLRARSEEVTRLARLERRASRGRVLVFAVALVNAWGVYALPEVPAATLWLPGLGFAALLLVHDSIRRRLGRAERAVVFYERGIARLEHRFAGQGRDGLRFLDPEHPYARALDLFGAGSLYELLCQAQTEAGEERLAGWLLGNHPRAAELPSSVRARQQAVDELRNALDLREDLFVAGPEVRSRVASQTLTEWGRVPGEAPGALRITAAALAVSLVAALTTLLWTGGGGALVLTAGAAAAALSFALRRRVKEIAAGVEGPARSLIVLGRLLERIEQEHFCATRLRELRVRLDTDGAAPSKQIARLRRRVELLDARHNQLFALIAPLLLFTTQVSLAIEAWRLRTGPELEHWIDAIGEIEALCDLAGYAYEHPGDPFPELVENGPLLQGRQLAHPLLPEADAIGNDVDLGPEARLWIVSGSNMSGKSTLLRTLGINAALAFAGAPVRAKSLRLSPLAIGSSIHVQDSLQNGRSSFFAEITRLRQIMELAEASTGSGAPALFLLDEILAGTNSHDRSIGAAALLARLIECGAIGLITTHDLSLCTIANELGTEAENVHFEDRLDEGEILFDYRLRPGVVEHSNALALMRSVGLEI